jgi:glycosyltransferase involved in cell wall biosynthesis
MHKHKLSIVIPVFNEQDNIVPLHEEVTAVCRQEGYDFEVIIVDDGSSDRTGERARSLNPVKYIRFRRNFGQTAAMDAGIKHATGGLIITMDGDRQNDPADIPRLISYLEDHDLDLVSGWRKDRKDTFMKHFVSRGANMLRKMIINDGIHDSGCSLKIYRTECFEGINLYGEMHRFIPALLKIRGFRIGEMVVSHRPRTAGKTKYNWKRAMKGFIDMLAIRFWTRFSTRPLHLFGTLGILFIFLSLVTGVFTVLDFLEGMEISDTALPILTTFLFLGGLQMFFTGLTSDILMRNYYESGDKPGYYNIREIISNG